MPDHFPPFDFTTDRLAYVKGANSPLGAMAVMIVMAIWFPPPSFGAFTLDQFIWGVAIFIFLISLSDLVAAIVVLLRPPLLLFRFDDDGVRIGGAAAAIPWPQIVSIDVRRDGEKSILQLAVRPPVPALSWTLRHVFGLRTTARDGMMVYGIPRERLAQGDSELTHGLDRVANRLARP